MEKLTTKEKNNLEYDFLKSVSLALIGATLTIAAMALNFAGSVKLTLNWFAFGFSILFLVFAALFWRKYVQLMAT